MQIIVNHKKYELDGVQSSFTGQILLYFNTGGIRNATVQNEQYITIIKVDTFKPATQILDCPKST